MASTSKPQNRALYARVKVQARRKFAVYPSAYANAWLVKRYKSLGGKYKGSRSKSRALQTSLRSIHSQRRSRSRLRGSRSSRRKRSRK